MKPAVEAHVELDGQELADISAALRTAATADEDQARELGREHALFDSLVGRAARLRRLRAKVQAKLARLVEL